MFQFLTLCYIINIGPSSSVLFYGYLTARHRSIDSPALVMAINISIIEKVFCLRHADVILRCVKLKLDVQKYRVILKKVLFGIFGIILVSKEEEKFTIESKDKGLSPSKF